MEFGRYYGHAHDCKALKKENGRKERLHHCTHLLEVQSSQSTQYRQKHDSQSVSDVIGTGESTGSIEHKGHYDIG
jgi:hypothetical protein